MPNLQPQRPAIREVCNNFAPQGVDFFLVYVDPHETDESIRRHRDDYEYTCPALRDNSHELVRTCAATVTPEAVVLNTQHEIVYQGRIDNLYVDFGQARTSATAHELADALDAVVRHRPVAVPRTKAVGCYIGDLQ